MLTCPLAPGITCSLLGCACHSACGTTLSPKRDQNYARSETKFTPEASQNLRPKRTPALRQSSTFQHVPNYNLQYVILYHRCRHHFFRSTKDRKPPHRKPQKDRDVMNNYFDMDIYIYTHACTYAYIYILNA